MITFYIRNGICYWEGKCVNPGDRCGVNANPKLKLQDQISEVLRFESSSWMREKTMKKVCSFVSIAFMAALLAVNVYNSIVDARSWGANIPDSILTARSYFKVVNPGTFFRVASPLNQLFALVALVVCWKSGKRVRLYFGLAFLFAVLAEALTFAFFFPRNEILFIGAEGNAEVFAKVWSEWSRMNWVRNLLLAFGLVCSMKGLDSVYKRAQAGVLQATAR